MSVTATETAQNPTEAGSSTEPAAAAATATPEASTVQQTPSEQPAAAATNDGQQAETPTPQGAPEKYEFVAPDGKTYDPQVLTSFTEAARAANLTQEAAQKLIDTMAPQLVQRQAEQVAAIHKEWTESSKTDAEFGGTKLTENLGVVAKALNTFATPELRTLLESTGLGNHPEVIRVLFRVGKAISEDKFVSGRQEAPASNDAKSFYPNSQMN